MLQTGVSAVDITPPLGIKLRGYFEERIATTVHDPLLARSFVLSNDSGAVAITVCDNIGIGRAALDGAKARVAEYTDLRPEQVLIGCTHTHTGPFTGDDDYTHWLADRIADGVRVAWESRVPGSAGWARTEEPRLTFNRRYRMKDGTVRTNPGVGNPDVVKPAGPIDPAVDVLVLQAADGAPLGALANHAMHYIGVPQDRYAISADYFGYFSTMLQRLRGTSFVAALSQGAAGNINNIDVLGNKRHRNDRYQHCERAGTLIAANALWAWNEAEFTDDLVLGAAMAEVPLPIVDPVTPEQIAQAEEIAGRLAAKKPVLMGERALHRRVERLVADPPKPHSTWVQALRIGDLGIATAPGEFFVELGLDVKQRSPASQTMLISLANDSIGYIPDRQAFTEGAYEPESSHYQPGVGELIADEAVKLLEQLWA